MQAGEPALAVLRPQHLELCRPGDGPFVGEVSQTVFLGPFCRHDVVLDGGALLRVNGDPDRAPPNGFAQGVRIRSGHGAVVRQGEETQAGPETGSP
jgi:TOBE domain-containing protein